MIFTQGHQPEDVDVDLDLSHNFMIFFFLLDLKHVDCKTISKKEHMEN